MSVNKVILLGFLGQNPDIRTTQDGKKIASFSLATSEQWKDKNGEKKEKTEWSKVVIYNENLASIVEKYVKKGTRLYIEGKLQTRKYTDKSGVEKYTTEVVLQGFNGTLQIINSSNKNSNEDDYSEEDLQGVDGKIETNNSIEDDIPW